MLSLCVPYIFQYDTLKQSYLRFSGYQQKEKRNLSMHKHGFILMINPRYYNPRNIERTFHHFQKLLHGKKRNIEKTFHHFQKLLHGKNS